MTYQNVLDNIVFKIKEDYTSYQQIRTNKTNRHDIADIFLESGVQYHNHNPLNKAENWFLVGAWHAPDNSKLDLYCSSMNCQDVLDNIVVKMKEDYNSK